ncbi:MAG: DUF2971 domain-containing protein [Alphaproteobacteria bacterium]|nr:MAG: DUF2971 domain-containing protein [Alphaproteobacteria bacterium]
MVKTSDVYPRISHYTTLQGAVGILQSQSLWSTHCKFLNDTSERILIKDKLIEILYPHVLKKCQALIEKYPKIKSSVDSDGGVAAVAKNETATIVDVQYRVTGDEIYVTSFCGETGDAYIDRNGLLSQWRGYGRDGGISLVFNTKKMEDILQMEADTYSYAHLSLDDLIYSHDTKKI